MPRVNCATWQPRGVESLEPAAESVVRSDSNTLVVAGPGAGKTELLAQRACYLLETRVCPAPLRILAISFKRDAAKNLAERVALRCGDKASRFDSLTLDAFGKSLVDRFRCALPTKWLPSDGYEVMVKYPSPAQLRDWFDSVRLPSGLTRPNVRIMSDAEVKQMFENCTFGVRLPYDAAELPATTQHSGLQWWEESLRAPAGEPAISFPMLNRLAAFLLRENPKIVAALQATYAFVFLDEFQDTTDAQYDVVQSAFLPSNSVLTAVGDSKQRIMVWAGAMQDAFERFETDFQAGREHLIRNYRSSPELVRIQHYIATAIETNAPAVKAVKSTDAGSACSILEFATPEQEATSLAQLIASDINENGLRPRDFCILARQRTADMISALEVELAKRGFRLRDESTLQDILSEPVVDICLAVLRLATRERDPEAWEFLVGELGRVTGHTGRQLESETSSLLLWARDVASQKDIDFTKLPADIVNRVGEQVIRVSYAQYSTGSFLSDLTGKLGKVLAENGSQGLRVAVDDLMGHDIIPAMTVHKSKGLEFHTVVFMGLEDSQHWNFAKQPEEETRGFFVAFSRAIRRVVFTYSDVRDGKYGRKTQTKTAIKGLYSILHSAGVQSLDLRTAGQDAKPQV